MVVKMEHVLILIIAVFLLYLFMNRCSNDMRSGNNFSVGGPCICKKTRDDDPDSCFNSTGAKAPKERCINVDTETQCTDAGSYCDWEEDIPDSWERPDTPPARKTYWPKIDPFLSSYRPMCKGAFSTDFTVPCRINREEISFETKPETNQAEYICREQPFYKDDTCEIYLPDCSESCSGHTYSRGQVANVPEHAKGEPVCNTNPCDAKTTPYASLYNFDICGNNRTDFIGKGPCCDTRKCK